MKVFLDANVLVSVLNREYPVFTHSARVLSLSGKPEWELFTSPLCLAIAWYFAEKKSGREAARNKIGLLAKHIQIAGNSQNSVNQVLENKRIYDFEDGLEYYAAKDVGCSCIITADITDFYFSEIEVLDSVSFVMKYLKHK